MSININPLHWGPPSWKFLHYITLSYPDNPSQKDKIRMYNFFIIIKDLLPCEKCRYNYNEHLVKFPLTYEILSSRFTLVNWLINIHNEVNITLGKNIITYNEFLEIYVNNEYNSKINPSFNLQMSTKTMTIFLIIILIFVLLLAIKLKNK